MSVFYNNALIGASGQAAGGGYQISRSVRLNSADSAFFSRTPASAGNRKTWTWAGWVKRSGLGSFKGLFSAGSNNSVLMFNSDVLQYYEYNGSVETTLLNTTQVLRDPSAWYHIVLALDTAQATASNRCKIYINGTQITAFTTATYPAQNYDTYANSAIQHYIGYAAFSTRYFDGYLADVHFIDGQALTPTSFGEFDTNNVWQPKAYSGTYGTNGFHLNFADNSAATANTLGKDTSGNGNNWTPNNLTAGPAVVSNSWSGYFDGNGDYLTAPANAAFAMGTGDFTLEFWAYSTDSSSNTRNIFDTRGFSTDGAGFFFGNNGTDQYRFGYGLSPYVLLTASGRQNFVWQHIALVRSGSTITIYINGSSAGTLTNATNWSSNLCQISGFVGAAGSTEAYLGRLSNLRLVKGTAVYTSNFTPPTAPLTAITNTSLLTLQSSTFVDNSTNNFTITANGNARVDFRSPFEEPVDTDSLVDVPTNGTEVDTGAGGEVRGNYATLNPLGLGGGTLSNGNLSVSTSTDTATVSAFAMTTGKWYWEVTLTTSSNPRIGVYNVGAAAPAGLGATANGWCLLNGPSRVFNNGSTTNYGTFSGNNGDVVMLAYDADAGKLWYGVNGSWFASGNPATGANPSQSSVTGSAIVPASSSGTGANVHDFNFGQRQWAYQAPAGFKALCTTNLPTPTITKPSTVMDVVTYTGNGSTLTPTSTLSFSPDLVWIKSRSAATDHALYDAVRGAQARLESNNTDTEVTSDNGLTAFNSNGFTLGTLAQVNTNAATYAAWTWDAGSSTVTNTAGSISSQVRANPSAGFSIVSYTGVGASAQTVGHGLGVAPSMVIIKERSQSTGGWITYHSAVGATAGLYLNGTSAPVTSGNFFNNTAPTSSVFSIGGSGEINDAGQTNIAYCFAPVAGYSTFGSYTGNGSTDGPYIHLGFRPAFVIIKCSSASITSWMSKDYKRAADYNPASGNLYLDATNAEDTINTVDMDFLANGIKLRGTYSGINSSSNTYIYAAWAQHPFALARAR